LFADYEEMSRHFKTIIRQLFNRLKSFNCGHYFLKSIFNSQFFPKKYIKDGRIENIKKIKIARNSGIISEHTICSPLYYKPFIDQHDATKHRLLG
jgi:hypothetical protein